MSAAQITDYLARLQAKVLEITAAAGGLKALKDEGEADIRPLFDGGHAETALPAPFLGVQTAGELDAIVAKLDNVGDILAEIDPAFDYT